jgi:hypothetical protein
MCLSFQCALALSAALCSDAFRLAKSSEVAPVSQEVAVGDSEIVQARRHPSYQVFVARSRLPDINYVEPGILTVGSGLKLNLSTFNEVSSADKAELIRLLGVSPEFLAAMARRLSTNQVTGEVLAGQFRTALTDHAYLAERWRRYRPTVDRAGVKEEALRCLEAADIEKAWKLYLRLPRPAPPGGLQIKGIDTATK